MKKRIYDNSSKKFIKNGYSPSILVESPSPRYLWLPTILKVKVESAPIPKKYDKDGRLIDQERPDYFETIVFRGENKLDYGIVQGTIEKDNQENVTFNVQCLKHGESVGVLNLGQRIKASLDILGYRSEAEVIEVVRIPEENPDMDLQCKTPEICQGLPKIIVPSDLPEIQYDSNNESYMEQLYFDGPCKIENLRRDTTWEKCLMSPGIIKRKHFAKNIQTEDEELAKESPDAVVLVKCMRARQEIPEWEPKKCYEEALSGLDKRVQDGEPDKPEIRQKIQNKIAELSL